ncbi:hypothetical protein L965_1258 [Leuconostoc pseudomesenteroides PS12]|nr:hypothetical protein L964_305 [Leuconostoc pseudomesenteroides 1159]KDA50720.1 hypothetical protein L965_1258 [Leuconostoc pseudomesenteroides PS12]CCJ67579.1 hypothetical protein Q5C_01910 [Leuconostoc pseudomesenteroides 4882]
MSNKVDNTIGYQTLFLHKVNYIIYYHTLGKSSKKTRSS